MDTFTPPTIEELQDQFPQYSIEGFIAQGGMGAVYLARQVSLDRPVAIKILPREFGDDKDYRISFETEAKAMARLNHTNLVGIYDFGELDGMLYIVMEYIPGRTLFDSAHGQQVDQKEAARLISDMSEGLAHAHEAGMLHRDIKPANVLIDDQAKPKIVDFGLARPMGEEQTEGVVFGTPGYTAPEVLDNPFAVDHRSDIFSMGVMLYELLTGHMPADPMVLASVDSGADIRFDEIINKSIHPNPAMRYSSAADLSNDLNDLIDNFDQKPTGRMVSPLLANTGGSMAVPNSLVGGGSVTYTAKKSNKGIFVMTFILLIGGGGALFLIQENNEKKKALALEKAAAIEAAEKQELELERKKVEERKRLAALELEKKKAAKQEAENAELATIRQKRREARLELLAEEEKEKALMAEKKRLAILEQKEKEAAAVTNFDVKAFLENSLEEVEDKMAALNAEKREEVEPIVRRVERDLKREVRRATGRFENVGLENYVDGYVDNLRETHMFDDVSGAYREAFKEGAEKVVEKYKEKIAEVIAPIDKRMEVVRKKYVDQLEGKQTELVQDDDAVGAALLKEPLEEVNDLSGFIGLFDFEVEEE